MISYAASQSGFDRAGNTLVETDATRSVGERVLVLASDEAEAENLRETLSERGLALTICTEMNEWCAEFEIGAGVGLLDGDHISRAEWTRLAQTLAHQPAWSDFPLIVLTEHDEFLEWGGLVPDPAGNAILLERSTKASTLASAVRMALRSRRRQYLARETHERVGRHANELEKRVADRTRSLQATVQSLEGVLYHVAHDLRAPLRTMQGFTSILLEEHGPALGETGADFARRISVAATRMDKLIQDLLVYGRLAQATPACGPLNLNQRLRGVLEHLAQQIHSRKATVRIEESLPQVKADPRMLDLILTHLINNALIFVAPGTMPEINISAERLGSGMVRLSIQDNGLGIAPEHHERIFRVFERLHGNDVYTGTGIGLAIVRKGAERMGGMAGVESKPGAGSCFWLDLPAATLNNE